MSQSVQMPALGESVTEGTVTRWLKSVGDAVEVDEPLLEVSTDKVDTEVPSPFAGTLQQILVEEDETVEVGVDLAVIGDGEDGGDQKRSDGSAEAPQEAPAPQEAQQEATPRQEEPSSSPAPQGDGGGDGGQGTPVTMPALGESVTEGTVTRWLKSEGDTIELDEPLLEVSTDKVDTEVPSPVAGTITKILVGEDETVEVGADLAIVGGPRDGGSPAGSSSSADEGTAQASSGSAGAGSAEEAAAPPPGDADDAEDLGDEATSREAAVEDAERKTASRGSGSDDSGDPEAPPAGQSEPEQDTDSYTSPEPQVPTGTAQPQPSTTSAAGDTTGASSGSGYVTPLVRKLAQQQGVDLSTLTGTGVGGRLRKQDVLDAAEKAQAGSQQQPEAPAPEAAAQAPAAPPQSSAGSTGPSVKGKTQETAKAVAGKRGTTEKMSRLRRVIAQRMVESLQVSAQLTSVVEVDVTRIARLRARAKSSFEQREGGRLSFMPFFALAVCEALKAYPQVNASVEGDSVVYHAQENLGIAVDTERGLLVPVIKEAGDLNLAGLNRRIADLAERTRTNKVTPDDLAGGTFTITNTGSRGALFDTPIINQPQVAILGTGAIVKRPVVVADGDGGESIAVRSMMYLALSYDHRIVDGADAARFLSTLKARLEEGDFESEVGL